MPIEIQTPKPAIQILTWNNKVTLTEINDSHEATYAMAKAQGISRYVHILVMTNLASFPFDPMGLWEVLFKHPEVVAVLVVDGPMMARTITTMLNAITRKVTLENFDTLEEAQLRAEELVADSAQLLHPAVTETERTT